MVLFNTFDLVKLDEILLPILLNFGLCILGCFYHIYTVVLYPAYSPYYGIEEEEKDLDHVFFTTESKNPCVHVAVDNEASEFDPETALSKSESVKERIIGAVICCVFLFVGFSVIIFQGLLELIEKRRSEIWSNSTLAIKS